MPDASTTHLVVNTGPGAPERIDGFGAGDRLEFVGFFAAAAAADGDAVLQSLVAGPDGGPALQVEVYEAGAATPAATVLLVGVSHALDPGVLLHW